MLKVKRRIISTISTESMLKCHTDLGLVNYGVLDCNLFKIKKSLIDLEWKLDKEKVALCVSHFL